MSIVHWMIVIGIVVLLFGRHKISDLMGDVAQGIKSFKRGMQEEEAASVETNDAHPKNRSSNAVLPSRVASPHSRWQPSWSQYEPLRRRFAPATSPTAAA
jgi:sec-independent protein translocase protein TatA